MTGEASTPDLIPRDSAYWSLLTDQARNAVDGHNHAVRTILNVTSPEPLIRYISVGDATLLSPSVRLNGVRIDVRFPDGYFSWIDEAAQWMNKDVPFRQRLRIAQVHPREDHSKLFHLFWSLWISQHEAGHAICGHLAFLRRAELVEFDMASVEYDVSDPDALLVRRALESDADIWATQSFFRTLAGMGNKGYWDGLYGQRDSSCLGLHDVAMIFLPLFLELDHAMADSDPQKASHPSAIERLLTFHLFGPTAYAKARRSNADVEIQYFFAGFREAVLATLVTGSPMFTRSPSWKLSEHKELLISKGVSKLRMFPFSGDWLQPKRR